MKAIARRSLLITTAAVPMVFVARAWAQDALPDARFVGFAQAVNEFQIAAGRLAQARSTNENVRGYASRAIAQATDDGQSLSRARSEAGVSYAPDGRMKPKTDNLMAQLNTLQGPQFDKAYATAQVSVMTDAEAQYGAYSQSGTGGALRRYAQVAFPKVKEQLEYARRIAGGL